MVIEESQMAPCTLPLLRLPCRSDPTGYFSRGPSTPTLWSAPPGLTFLLLLLLLSCLYSTPVTPKRALTVLIWSRLFNPVVKVTVLLNRRGVVSFEQLLLDISEALGFPRWHRGRVARLYTAHAREVWILLVFFDPFAFFIFPKVKGVCDFFCGEVAFLALSKTRPELSSVEEALEELFPEHSHYRASALRSWEKKLRPVPNKAAKADSGYSEGTDGGGAKQDTCPSDPRVSEQTDTRQQENSQKFHKRNSCRKLAQLPNNLQKLRVRGGVRERKLSVVGPFKHDGGLGDADVPSPVLCEKCSARRERHPEAIGTLSGRVPLPPVLKKQKERSRVEQEAKTPSLPRPISRDEEKSLMQLEPRSPAATSALPSNGSNLTPSDVERCYEIGRVIGDGNFAEVRECRRRHDDQILAVKIVERSKLTGREHMMQNELSLLGSLCHPRVVQLLAHHHTQTHSYLVMELVGGGDLFEAISDRGRFSEAEAGLMVLDVSDALSYIHSKSIVHRDLKPENLLIEKVTAGVCRLKLGDFGLAMVVTEPVFTICGTPTYVAPEILRETGYGVAVDVWALGVILYILLCGFAPFRSRDRDQEELFKLIKQAQLHFPSPFWDSASEGAKGLVRSLLQSDPAARLTAEQTLQHTWVKAMASASKQRAPTGKSQRGVQTSAAESLTDQTAGSKITLRRCGELTARGQEEAKPALLQRQETSTTEEKAPLDVSCRPEKPKSGELHETGDPDPTDLTQLGSTTTQTESSSRIRTHR
ncbi:doublecortin like kinase 3 [Nothobranchius furzeri]|uniref:Doublecortin like kinase 3 n=1 Tax=Nothobranchius furzeri TaxID=105023 RepID=A0A9D2XZL4_NOTFU|nr:doublecortin like kinase 3 [Nothobranchius furzeri]